MLKKIKFIEFIYYFLIFVLFGISFYFSTEYAVYNTDFIHWSFILDQVNSFINGQNLYKDIFLQYGEGQVTLLTFINNFYKINIYSLGIISSLIFGLKFFLIFKILTTIVSSRLLSFTCTFFIFISITYSQIPWPDFYSGLCLLIFFYTLIVNDKDQNLYLIIFSSFLLFLSIYFRNTYLLNFILSIIVYFLYEIIFIKKKNLYIYKIFLITTFFLIIYLITLLSNDNLKLWFDQGFGLSNQYFGTSELELINRIKKYFYYIARLIYHIVLPKNLVNLFFSLCILINLIYLLFSNLLIKKKLIENSSIKFISIYGLCGLVQLMSHYEILRYINASISIYLVSFYFIEKIDIISKTKKFFFLIFFGLLYIINIASFFPMSSHNHKTANFPIETYNITNIKLFGKKKLSESYSKFYTDISQITCDKDHIYNLSWDKTYNFLCNEAKNIYKYNVILKNSDLLSRLQKGENLNNRIILSSEKLDNLEKIKELKLPKFFRYTKSDTYMRFYSDIVYIYK